MIRRKTPEELTPAQLVRQSEIIAAALKDHDEQTSDWLLTGKKDRTFHDRHDQIWRNLDQDLLNEDLAVEEPEIEAL